MKVIAPEKNLLIEKVAKAFQLDSSSDKVTIITRQMAKDAIPELLRMKNKIVELFPKENSKRIRTGVSNAKEALTVLRELLKYKSNKLLSTRTVKWNREEKRQIQIFTYRIL